MKPRSIPLTILLALLVASSVQAQGLSNIPAAFVDIGYGARPMGMGGAFVALADDANSVLWNPAGLTRLARMEATFMYADQMGLVPYYYSAFGGRFLRNHAHGEALIYSGDEFLSETTAIISYAYSFRELLTFPLDRLRWGISLKIRYASFGNDPAGGLMRQTGDAFGYGLDLGVQWELPGRLSTGMVLRDAVNSLKWNNTFRNITYYQDVPWALIIGVAFRSPPNFALAVDLNKSLHSDTIDRLQMGIEKRLFGIFYPRAGYSQNIAAEVNRKYTLGLGIELRRFRMGLSFDFAYLFSELKNTPRISSTFFF